MKNSKLLKLVFSALFLALGMVLPFLTGQVLFGKMLLPMHLPVMLCGLICGPYYGLCIGFILPFMRSFLFGMPALFPDAIVMAFELATYAFVLGFIFSKMKKQNVLTLYFSLIVSMISGRIVWALVKMILIGVGGDGFTFNMFIMSGFVNAVSGIVLQLVLIPAIMILLDKTKLLPFSKTK